MQVSEVALTLRVDRPFPFYSMGGLIMPWVGATDAVLRSGYMVIVDTPFDAGMRLADCGGRTAPEVYWQPEMGRFGYARKLRYHFFADGGYVAQAKHYRDYVRRTRECPSLRERARQRSHIDQLIGAVHIYAWDDGRDLAFARELKDAGIERAWIGWDPSHPPYPATGFDEGLKALGYLAGVYDLYRDCYNDAEWAPKAATNEVLRGMWLHRYLYPELFQKIVARLADNSPMQIRVSRDVGLMRYWTCTKAQLPHVPDRITRELKTYPHNSVFVDVTLAAGPFECHSPDHPMTRREDASARLAIHQLMAERLHLVVGSEWGADYGVPHTEFLHGVMTLHNFSGDGTRDRASAHYHGDWSDTRRPSMVLGEAQPTDTYLKYGVGASYRVPLYELVFHDCIVSSWRWDESSHKLPDVWARKDLFNALYGTAPLWNLDRATWQKHRARFVASFRALQSVLRAVGYDAMLDHRFLTPDRQVQTTAFASGRRVIANFAGEPRSVDGVTVPAGGFVLTGN
jgi:hypothetical protein